MDVVFFHDVFHNMDDRKAYLRTLVRYSKPGGRIAIVEQEIEDPIAKKWDFPEDRITREHVAEWMAAVGFRLANSSTRFTAATTRRARGCPSDGSWFTEGRT